MKQGFTWRGGAATTWGLSRMNANERCACLKAGRSVPAEPLSLTLPTRRLARDGSPYPSPDLSMAGTEA